jgi:hypothetical protein
MTPKSKPPNHLRADQFPQPSSRLSLAGGKGSEPGTASAIGAPPGSDNVADIGVDALREVAPPAA